MSEMRLRHKKPINSYVGQANPDSNQAIDEDFARNSLQNKKIRMVKQRPSNEQTKKYAQILCEFINVVNQDYRNFLSQFPEAKHVVQQEDAKVSTNDNFLSPKYAKDNIYGKSIGVVSKQQQKSRVSENNNNKNTIQSKKIKKDRLQFEELQKSKQITKPLVKPNSNYIAEKPSLLTRQPPIFPPSNPHQVIHPNNPISNAPTQNNQEGINKPAAVTNNTSSFNSNIPLNSPSLNPGTQQNSTKAQGQVPGQIGQSAINPQFTSLEQLQQYQQLQQQIYQNQLFAMNNGLFSMFPYGFPQMMNYQMYLQQVKSNPYLAMQSLQGLQNMQGMFGMGQNPQNSQNGYIPFSKLPFQNNAKPQTQPHSVQENSKKQQISSKKSQNFQPQGNKISQATCDPQIQNQSQILAGNPQIPTTINIDSANLTGVQSLPQPIDFKRKSCYHVAIAYNIHFARLKDKGLLNCVNTQESYLKLDPTFPAKMIRQRKNSTTTTANPNASFYLNQNTADSQQNQNKKE